MVNTNTISLYMICRNHPEQELDVEFKIDQAEHGKVRVSPCPECLQMATRRGWYNYEKVIRENLKE
jgi:hypothetical protein